MKRKPREESVLFRVSKTEKEQLETAAAMADMSVSAYIRRIIFARVRKENDE